MRGKLLIKVLLFLSLSCTLSLAKEKEISWEEASLEVDGFPFSYSFIDSVKKTHNVIFPKKPLRSLCKNNLFSPETLVYEVSWGSFPAGYVILTTTFDSVMGTIRIGGKALSNNFISMFYKIRDYVISSIDPEGLYPLFFEQHLREGKYVAEEYLLFDQIKGKVYSQSKKEFKVEKAPKFVQDYLSVLYLVRATKPIIPGEKFSEPIFIHSKVHSISFAVKEEKDTIEVKAGKFKTIKIVPRLAGEGRAFNKKDKMEIWLTSDKRKTPVMVKAKIKFGYLHARLIWYNNS
ncbi:MAG: DUF3108 domain-containing protein [Chitinispirillaceae bacterium]|nr:DUF3108 domain-containing protein [Chitinispirillaceae bacterium]